jgi:hypothetical protein|uniref:Uncharacterized protein n=1 Tax=Picea glauca TaxID=3330 RepID=A0A101M0E0_PICGL|nr:hypothetical protein ABT39_MTgene4639 [Picea glauca]QHR92474.1 hypothetical protein Q903MT_gene6520 [Picea sitchensis]
MDAARRGHGSLPRKYGTNPTSRAVTSIPRKLPLPLLLVVVLQSILSYTFLVIKRVLDYVNHDKLLVTRIDLGNYPQ